MAFFTRSRRALPPSLVSQADKVGRSDMDRREFLALASAFGASATTAYSLLGLARPAAAQETPKMGGTVRIQQDVRALADPRTFDWPQIANFTRGWLENLVAYESDGTFSPVLLESWEISEDARTYTLHVRQGVQWNDGTAFTAADVARNITGWCDRDVPGNSMASRFATLIDPDTNLAIENAIEVVDDLTVRLKLPRPDVSLIPGMADYPAAMVPAGFDPAKMLENPVGTGPYLPESHVIGEKSVLVRNANHTWWNAGNGAWADRVEFIDLGTDPSVWARAAIAGEVDMTYSVDGEFADVIGGLEGWTQHEVISMATVVVRPNQLAEVKGIKPYADLRVRQAIMKAVDNGILLELGNDGRGQAAENHHIGPAHPEYSNIGVLEYDPAGARELLKELGAETFEMEIHTIDDSWRKNTADAVVAQLRDAGFNAKTTIVPGNVYWENWNTFPFSATDWNHRPLGVQVWALAYRSGEAWNEFGYANPQFDAVLDEALGTLDIAKRRELVAKGEKILQDDAVTIQPYWRLLANHTAQGLGGGAHHISFEIRPAALFWT